ncbi:hypothetical protein ZIOFF_043063 [Zingiber officinale]|uniref:Transglycosylase SLT domain-containing protein n=1 Tax=Zingiber officinale TaxID=94328 RepID=A0A8J5FZS3_ZINOF|nr:hypothetical protein ZIOFF_043063 [Zingiber officinale]
MSVSYKYWDDCVDPDEMRLLWKYPEVRKEWIDAGENIGQKVLLSRDPDGQLYLTQTEMRAVAKIVLQRHFNSQIELEMICVIAEIASDRQLLAQKYNKKTKQTTMGIMQIEQETADWLVREIGYRYYDIEENSNLLFRPFVNVYFGAAYIKWLSCMDGNPSLDLLDDNEDLVMKHPHYFHINVIMKDADMAGVIEGIHGSPDDTGTDYDDRRVVDWEEALDAFGTAQQLSVASGSGEGWTYWDIRVSSEDMGQLWKHPEVLKEWTESGERPGKVRFSHDSEKRIYLSRVEVKGLLVSSMKDICSYLTAAMKIVLIIDFIQPMGTVMGFSFSNVFCQSRSSPLSNFRLEESLFVHRSKPALLSTTLSLAVAEIITSRWFVSKGIQPTTLAALADICSMRFVNGVRARIGLLGIDYPTAAWLYKLVVDYKDVQYRAYKVVSVDDLYNPFVSMYFGAAYLAWLSVYEGRLFLSFKDKPGIVFIVVIINISALNKEVKLHIVTMLNLASASAQIGSLDVAQYEANNVVKKLPIFEPSVSLLESLLGACQIHSNAEIGEAIGKLLIDVIHYGPTIGLSPMGGLNPIEST